MTRTVYDVTPHGQGWQVKRRGADRASSAHATKEEAVQAARALALANKPSQVVVHTKDGKIEFEWTYEKDPFPPPG